jgi:hypothetical protein
VYQALAKQLEDFRKFRDGNECPNKGILRLS